MSIPRRLLLLSLLALLAACSPSAPRSPSSSASVSSPVVSPAPAATPRPSSTPDSIEPWTFETYQGEVLRTAHYSIYTTNSTPQIIDRLPLFMESALLHYSTAITPLPTPEARMDMFLMANRSQWQRLTLRMLGERGIQVTYIERGGFTHAGRSYLFDIGAADTLSIAAHEGWHQFSQTTFKERLPLTLEEGIAAFMEGHRWLGGSGGRDVVFLGWSNLERFDRLREAAARTGPSGTGQTGAGPAGLMSLEELLASNPESLLVRGPAGPLTFYAQAWSLIHFLREGERGRYATGFKRMVADAAGGHLSVYIAAQLRLKQEPILPNTLARQAFRAYINPDLAALNREYQDFVRRIVQTGARDEIVQGRSPLAGR